MCEGAPNQTPDPKNSTAPGPRPSVLKFLDPPLSYRGCSPSFKFKRKWKKYYETRKKRRRGKKREKQLYVL